MLRIRNYLQIARNIMSDSIIEMHPNRITIDALGPPGQRVFLLQAVDAYQKVSLKLEKQQASVLAQGILQFLDELGERFPERDWLTLEPYGADLLLEDPVEILFVIGQMGLGYDENEHALVLVAQEITAEEDETGRVVRFWTTPGQMRAMSKHVETVVSKGREICSMCQQPIDPKGHFCPKSNGRQLKNSMA